MGEGLHDQELLKSSCITEAIPGTGNSSWELQMPSQTHPEVCILGDSRSCQVGSPSSPPQGFVLSPTISLPLPLS